MKKKDCSYVVAAKLHLIAIRKRTKEALKITSKYAALKREGDHLRKGNEQYRKGKLLEEFSHRSRWHACQDYAWFASLVINNASRPDEYCFGC